MEGVTRMNAEPFLLFSVLMPEEKARIYIEALINIDGEIVKGGIIYDKG